MRRRAGVAWGVFMARIRRTKAPGARKGAGSGHQPRGAGGRKRPGARRGKGGHPYGTPVVVRGRDYRSQAAAAHALGVSRQRISQLLKRDRERALGRAPLGRPKIPVTIGGARYESRKDAARILGITVQTVTRWSRRAPPLRHIRLIIMDLETLECSVPEPYRAGILAARRLLLDQADLLDQLADGSA